MHVYIHKYHTKTMSFSTNITEAFLLLLVHKPIICMLYFLTLDVVLLFKSLTIKQMIEMRHNSILGFSVININTHGILWIHFISTDWTSFPVQESLVCYSEYTWGKRNDEGIHKGLLSSVCLWTPCHPLSWSPRVSAAPPAVQEELWSTLSVEVNNVPLQVWCLCNSSPASGS